MFHYVVLFCYNLILFCCSQTGKYAYLSSKETRSDIRDARQELRQAGEVAAGNPYLLRMKFLDLKYAPLDRRWSPADAYAECG